MYDIDAFFLITFWLKNEDYKYIKHKFMYKQAYLKTRLNNSKVFSTFVIHR